MKTILYVEENENDFINALIKRTDVNIVILRFVQNYNFTEEHLQKTAEIPTFVLNKKASLESEKQRFIAFLEKKQITIDFFYNDSEYNQELIQRFARELCLPGALSNEQAITVRDKVIMKQFIRKLGFECMEYMTVSSKKDLERATLKLGYPLIVKWRKGVSSIDVYKVNTWEELNGLNLDYSSGKYMAESFCPYKIWCLDAIVSRGEVIGNPIGWLPYTNLEFAEKKERFVQIAVNKAPANWKFSVYELTSKIIQTLGFERGYLHLEAFITPEGNPIICEFAWRTVGDHMLSDYSVAYNRDIFEMLIYSLIDKEQKRLEEGEEVCADVFLPIASGKIEKISELDSFREMPEYCAGEIFYKEGDMILSKRKYTDSAGWIQIKEKSIERLMNTIEKIYKKYCLIVN